VFHTVKEWMVWQEDNEASNGQFKSNQKLHGKFHTLRTINALINLNYSHIFCFHTPSFL